MASIYLTISCERLVYTIASIETEFLQASEDIVFLIYSDGSLYPYNFFLQNLPLFSPNDNFFLQTMDLFHGIRRSDGPNAGPDLSYPRNVPIFNHKTEIWRRWSSGRPRNRTWHFDTTFFSKIKNIQDFSPNHTTFFSKTYTIFLQNIKKFLENPKLSGC